jgi:hypothetical protein
MKRRYVILFGRAYVWHMEDGKLSLRPDVHGYLLFPNSTRRAILAAR